MESEAVPGVNERLSAIIPALGIDAELADTLRSRAQVVSGESTLDVINTAASNVVPVGQELDRIVLANSVAEISGNSASLVKIADKDDNVSSVADLASAYCNPQIIAESLSDDAEGLEVAEGLSHKLYLAEPAAVLAGMVANNDIISANDEVKQGVASYFRAKVPGVDVLVTPVPEAMKKMPKLFEDIKDSTRDAIVDKVHTMRRVNALAPDSSTVTALLSMNMKSCTDIAMQPVAIFEKSAKSVNMSSQKARQVHSAAVNMAMTYSNIIISAYQAGRGSGLFIDGRKTYDGSPVDMEKIAHRLQLQVNFDTIFGGNDETITEEWGTIYGPAAYFVDLLQYLQTKPYEPDSDDPWAEWTALEVLSRKRPDLALYELTKENVITPVPYIDLVNEIMEAFIINLTTLMTVHVKGPDKLELTAFNVQKNCAADLLWRPQNTNIKAYGYLAEAIYPLSLPYHQPIDTARTHLQFLGIDRAELIDKFRSRHPPGKALDEARLRKLHTEKLDRVHDAERLGLTEEEYRLLTKEGFQSPNYYEAFHGLDNSKVAIQYGISPVHEHFGYKNSSDLHDQSPDGNGLRKVRSQLLRRTGISWVDLVSIVKTKYLNPHQPTGKDQAIHDAFHASYRYLQTLVIPGSVVPDRYKNIRRVLRRLASGSFTNTEIDDWVDKKFRILGGLIVLESNDGKYLQLVDDHSDSQIFDVEATAKPGRDAADTNKPKKKNKPNKKPGTTVGSQLPTELRLQRDGILVNQDSVPVGNVDITGRLLFFSGDENGTPITVQFRTHSFEVFGILGGTKTKLADVDKDGHIIRRTGKKTGQKVEYIDTPSNGGSSNISKVTLQHLDGTSLTNDEWNKLQLFIRLWRKLGWPIAAVDMALTALESTPVNAGSKEADGNGEYGKSRIMPETLHQLSVIKSVADFTGFSIEKTLALFTDIPVSGNESLYSRTFLQRSIPGTLSHFQPDKDGQILAGENIKISEQALGLMANLGIRTDDLHTLLSDGWMTDELNLPNVSALYRYSALSSFFNITTNQLLGLLRIFDMPLKIPSETLQFLQTWRNLQGFGFNIEELSYITAVDESNRCLLDIDEVKIAVTCEAYRNDIIAINDAHRPLPPGQGVTEAMVKAKTVAYFGEEKAKQIMQFLDGRWEYSVDVPKGINLDELQKGGLEQPGVVSSQTGGAAPVRPSGNSQLQGVTYIPGSTDSGVKGKLQIVGILSTSELKSIADMASSKTFDKDNGAWITELASLAREYFKSITYGIFPMDSIFFERNGDASSETQATSAEKYQSFFEKLLPKLTQKLTQNAIIARMASVVGTTDLDLITTLLQVIKVPSSTGAAVTSLTNLLEVSKKDKDSHVEEGMWRGYLHVPEMDDYVFYFTSSTAPIGLYINDKSYEIHTTVQGQKKAFSTDLETPIRLESNQLYRFVMYGGDIRELNWQASGSPRQKVPASCRLPDLTSFRLGPLFNKLRRAAIVCHRFGLSAEDVAYMSSHSQSFAKLDFGSIKIQHLQRIQSFVSFRSSLPSSGVSPLKSLFIWADAASKAAAEQENGGRELQGDARQPSMSTSLLPAKIASVTGWDASQIDLILQEAEFFDQNPVVFTTEKHLVQMHTMLEFSKKAVVDIPSLFYWARPVDRDTTVTAPIAFEKQFLDYHGMAMSIRLAAQARCTPNTYDAGLRPISDAIRDNQRNAMVDYLVNQDELIRRNVVDADSLFEFFLIDVQMTPLVETSRIRQAISTIQLFVQRCFLGLESEYVPTDSLDRTRWEWMKNYSTWASNRKVFLYPENLIGPSLRDDKSPFFKELEAELAQNELTKETVNSVMRSYMSKLADVANLEPVSLYLQRSGDQTAVVHLFGRTRNAPFDHYNRSYNLLTKEWTPWTKMAIEIPHYITKTGKTGSYLIPAVLGNRLLVFIPQIMMNSKTTDANPVVSYSMPEAGKGGEVKGTQVGQLLEIRMSWTECRNGSWTPRQQTSDAITWEFKPTEDPQPIGLDELVFVALEREQQISDSSIAIAACSARYTDSVTDPNVSDLTSKILKKIGTFHFSGGTLSVVGDDIAPGIKPRILQHPRRAASSSTQFFGSHLNGDGVYPTQATYTYDAQKSVSDAKWLSDATPWIQTVVDASTNDVNSELVFPNQPTTDPNQPKPEMRMAFFSKEAQSMMNQAMGISGASGILDEMPQETNKSFYGIEKELGTELCQPYSLYHWEMGLHIPMLLADRFLQSQQFELALSVCHLVFDPVAPGNKTDLSRIWKFFPFKDIQRMPLEDYLLNTISSNSLDNTNAEKIVTDWRNNAFRPHLVARSRPLAYMKWIVMKYIEILIAYGDFYFRQNTLDSIPNAIQMYILASHMYGPRGQKIPRRHNSKPMTYMDLSKKDPFSNAIVEVEQAFPFTNQLTIREGVQPSSRGGEGAKAGLPGIFGFATAFYFSIPDNPNIRRLRDTVDDRLFKIRNSQDINGVQRSFPLFDPPLDPALLVRAKAEGINLSSVLSSINGPMPNYRFQYLLGRAIDMAVEVKSLGNALLTANEKFDGETMAALRAKHEANVYQIGIELKKTTLREAQAALEALKESRNAPAYRLQYYLKTLGVDQAIPGIEDKFQEVSFNMLGPVDEGNLKLLQDEKTEMDKLSEAHDLQKHIGRLETAASAFHALPLVSTHATPLGCGVAFHIGPANVAHVMHAVANGLRLDADALTFQSSSSGRKASNTRNMHDRYLQANLAGRELKTVDKQILSAEIRIQACKQEIKLQETQMEQARELEEYLRSKYTNAELYSWMVGVTRSLYYDIYNQAYDLASKAVKAFKYERPRDGTTYLQTSYWDSSRQGLMSGERLHFALKQLESAYLEDRGYDYEITKNISLRQLNSLALVSLRETGSCTFTIPEAVFDLDFPGHYLRRIKSISLSVPCVVGPYTSVSTTLRLESNKYRIDPAVGSSYAEDLNSEDHRFSSTRVPLSAIATSSGTDDSGMFEVNFRDERYLPFEGAGAISTWNLELSSALPQFDHQSISDVILHMRYTAIEGGGALKGAAKSAIKNALDTEEKCALVDLRNDMANSWASLSAAGEESDRVITMPRMETLVPFYMRQKKLIATGITVLSDVQLPNGTLYGDPTKKVDPKSDSRQKDVELVPGGGPIPGVTTLNGSTTDGLLVEGVWKLRFAKGEPIEANRAWMLVTMKSAA